jgi:hypothetical protein
MSYKTKRATYAARFQSDPEGIRTPNPQNRNLIFYPLNYEAIAVQK